MTRMMLRLAIAATVLACIVGALPARGELTRVGPEVEVNAETFGRLRQSPLVSMDAAGGFVVVWQSGGYGPTPDGSGTGIAGRRFDASSAPLGPEFQVNSFTTGPQFEPAVAGNGAGRFTVSWTSGSFGTFYPRQDGSVYGAFVQPYDASGTRLGGELQANTYTTGAQRATSVAMDAAGNFVVVWESVNYGDYGSVDQDGDGSGHLCAAVRRHRNARRR